MSIQKKILKNYYLVILITLIVSCKDKGDSSPKTDVKQGASNSVTKEDNGGLEVKTSNFSESDKSLICLWPKVGLRDIAGRKGAKYLSTIYFGQTVKFLGEKKEASDKKEYLNVELSDGEQGWVNGNLFAENGKLAILKSPLAIYKRPDIMEFAGNKFKRGEVVVLLDENKGEWKKITGFQKKDKGWIQKMDNFVYDDLDIKLGILYKRAMNEESKSKQQEKLKLIVENPAFQESKFIDIVNQSIEVEEEVEEDDFSDLDNSINSNQLYISTYVLNARSAPDSEADNVVFQLEKGNVCNILEKGNYETIKEKSSHWYKIEYQGNEGWVFGYYTSKK